MKKILLLFQMGSEVRQLGYSGFIDKMLDSGWGVLVVTHFPAQEFFSQLDPRVQVVSLPKARPDFWYEQMAVALDKAQALRRQKAGLSTWAYVQTVPQNIRQRLRLWLQKKFVRSLSASSSLFAMAQRWETARIRSRGQREYTDFLRRHRPDAIVVTVPRLNYQSHFLSAAERLGIRRYLFFHTNKDIVALSRLDHCFTVIGVWNDWMKKNLLAQNPGLVGDTVRITGCAHFDCIDRANLLMKKVKFREYLGLGDLEKLVLYTATDFKMLPQEERFIDVVSKALKALSDIPTRLVVRLNPMDDSVQLENSLKDRNADIIVLRPDWHYVRSRNLCYQRHDDAKLWNNLLYYSSVCINLPSTVTIECALAGLPVINLGFDLPGPKPLPGSVHAFWDVEYYASVRQTGAALLCESPSSLSKLLRTCLENKNILLERQRKLIDFELNGIHPPAAHLKYFELIENYLNNQ